MRGITVPVRKKIFCPGNHDIWVNGKSFDASWVKYYQILPELCDLLDWHYLPRQPIVIDNVGFAGTVGWYDYSSRNPVWDDKVTIEQYATKLNEATGAVWMDREFARFGKYSDQAVADHFATELIDDLSQISIDLIVPMPELHSSVSLNIDYQYKEKQQSNKEIDTIVIGTHIVPFIDFVKFTGGLEWDYFSAFIGNTTLGKIISNIKKDVKTISVFGHTHFPQRKKINDNLEAICCPIAYPNEWERKHSTLEDLFANRIISVDI